MCWDCRGYGGGRKRCNNCTCAGRKCPMPVNILIILSARWSALVCLAWCYNIICASRLPGARSVRHRVLSLIRWRTCGIPLRAQPDVNFGGNRCSALKRPCTRCRFCGNIDRGTNPIHPVRDVWPFRSAFRRDTRDGGGTHVYTRGVILVFFSGCANF